MRYNVETLPCAYREGQTMLRLSGPGCSAEILPWLGGTLISFVVRGQEWLDRGQGLLGPYTDVDPGTSAGAPFLFPTPNRVTDAAWTFKGQSVTQVLEGKKRVIHGLVFDAPFVVEGTGAEDDKAWATLSWTQDEQNTRWAAYPFPCKLTVTWTLTQDTIALDYAIENQGAAQMPFGFGWHPYLVRPEENITVKVGADEVWEAVECFPTGKILNVNENPKYDLRHGPRVDEFFLDDEYRGITPATPVEVTYRDLGTKLVYFQSADLTHVVVFNHNPRFFCVENQTCCTDAINLYARGVEGTGLIILEPWQTHTGRCGIVVELSASSAS
ncbi:MAG: aldose 1-epimerase [Clostridia bacterium]|nr:aldose 1-epimerase [Clostridia bacterium]